MKHPKISIVVPTYKEFDFLFETISSCLNQDYPGEIEIIVIDDGSSRSPRFVIDKFKEKEDRIKLIENETNLGVNKTLNKALTILSGEFVIFIGQDDILSSSHARLMHYSAKKDNAALVWCNSTTIDHNGKRIKRPLNDNLQKIKNMFARFFITKSNFISSTGVMLDVSILREIGGFPESFKNRGEWLLWIEIIFNHRISYNKEAMPFYRRHKKNLTNYLDDDSLPKEIQVYYSHCRDQASFKKTMQSTTFQLFYSFFDILWRIFRR
tara:strand:+ start:556 stop:1356 length:801 start_codon:yes stop_codon:yes gene_type:complete